MPTFHSLGISASLLVTDLQQTLSDEIALRMGAQHQAKAKRIQSLLSSGRVLLEQPIGSNSPKVGVVQFLGEDQDMVSLLVGASDRRYEDDGPVGDDDISEDEHLVKTNVEPTSTSDSTPSSLAPMQGSTSRRKSKSSANSQGTGKNSDSHRKQSTQITTPDHVALPGAKPSKAQTQSPSVANEATGQLALCLKVDFTNFYQKDKEDLGLLGGKDLKLEVFINGHLVEVCYGSSRPHKRVHVFRFSGTRFHRQAEKPWVYAPSGSHEADNVFDQRWTDVSKTLDHEASTRGVNKWKQRPLSAKYLAALSRSQLPEDDKLAGQQFAVVDLLITAGEGRKFGPNTPYLNEPARLSDMNFSGIAPIVDDLGPFIEQDGAIVLQDDLQNFVGGSGDPMDLEALGSMDGILKMSSEQPRTPSGPRTSKTMHLESAEEYHNLLDAAPMKRLLLKYENAKGHVKGNRTLRQRIGDMTKMSPMKQRQVLGSMKQELDDEAVATIKKVLGLDTVKTPTHEEKNVRFSGVEDVVNPAYTDNASNAQPLPTSANLSSSALSQANPLWVETESLISPELRATTMPEDDLEFAVGSPAFASNLPPSMAYKKTPASALSNSPTFVPVKYHHAHHNYQPTAQPIDPLLIDEQPAFSSPFMRTSSPVAPVTPQQPVTGSARANTKWHSREQTPGQALENFENPDFGAGSTVIYADGLKQRQVNKARGGEFEEQHFVVGMRFIVL